MTESTRKMRGTSYQRHEEITRANDAIQRARAASTSAGQVAIDQAKDRLGSFGGKTQL